MKPELMLAPGTYDACVFDFDGTLVDTDELSLDAMRFALARFGAFPTREWCAIEPVVSMGRCAERLYRDHGVRLDCSEEELAAVARGHWLQHRSLIRPTALAATAVALAAAGTPLAVASANYTQIVTAGLQVTGLAEIFQVVVAREDVRAHKPAPDAYLLAARRLGVPSSRCLAYDNSDDGLEAAAAAGMKVIDVRRHPNPERTS